MRPEGAGDTDTAQKDEPDAGSAHPSPNDEDGCSLLSALANSDSASKREGQDGDRE